LLLAGVLAAAAGTGPSGLAQAAAVKDQHAKELFSQDGVVGVGVGAENGEAVEWTRPPLASCKSTYFVD
jgi:hypothetical protein